MPRKVIDYRGNTVEIPDLPIFEIDGQPITHILTQLDRVSVESGMEHEQFLTMLSIYIAGHAYVQDRAGVSQEPTNSFLKVVFSVLEQVYRSADENKSHMNFEVHTVTPDQFN